MFELSRRVGSWGIAGGIGRSGGNDVLAGSGREKENEAIGMGVESKS